MADRRDRRFFGTCAVVLLTGLALLAWAAWDDIRDPNAPYTRGEGGALAGGIVLVGVAGYELARRLRRGPQEPGRHTRP